MSLFKAAQDHLRQLLGVVQTRLELLGLELADARDHLVALFALTAIAVFFSGVAVVTFLAWLVVVYWDHREMLLGGATLLFASFAVIAIWRASKHAQAGSNIFADSLQALQADRTALRPPLTSDNSPASSTNSSSLYVGD